MASKFWKVYTSRQCLHKAFSKQQQCTESWVKGFFGQIAWAMLNFKNWQVFSHVWGPYKAFNVYYTSVGENVTVSLSSSEYFQVPPKTNLQNSEMLAEMMNVNSGQ